MGGVGGVTSAKKKFKNFQVDFFLKIFFCFQPNYVISAALGFEDCRLATHLLNLYELFQDKERIY